MTRKMSRRSCEWGCEWGWRFLRPAARFRREITQPTPRFFTPEEREKMARTEGAYQYRGDAK